MQSAPTKLETYTDVHRWSVDAMEDFWAHFWKFSKLRASRDKGKFEASIRAIEKAAEGDDNLMPHFIEAAKAKATLGEMCDVLRGVFGEYREGSDF